MLRLSPSKLANFLVCAKKYELSLTTETPRSDAMREGLIFEAILLGEKPGAGLKEITGKTLEKLQTLVYFNKPNTHAQIIGDIVDMEINDALSIPKNTPFREVVKQCRNYLKIELPNQEKGYTFVGELDMYHPKGLIIDIKYTSNILTEWDYKANRKDLIQSIGYSYLIYKTEGKICPFYYFLVENRAYIPVVKKIRIDPTPEDFKWLEDILETVAGMTEFPATPGENNCNCFPMKGRSRCSMFLKCGFGRGILQATKKITFSSDEIDTFEYDPEYMEP